MQIGASLSLTDSEQRIARYLARGRSAIAREKGRTNARYGDQTDEQTDLDGVGGELAFCKLVNAWPDMHLCSYTTDTDPGDCTLPDGRTVDVKTTRYPRGKLLVARWKPPKVDLFALMVGTFPHYSYRGALSSRQMIDPRRLRDLGHGLGYAAEQHELVEI